MLWAHFAIGQISLRFDLIDWERHLTSIYLETCPGLKLEKSQSDRLSVWWCRPHHDVAHISYGSLEYLRNSKTVYLQYKPISLKKSFSFWKLKWLVGFLFYSIYSIFKLISKKKLNLHIYLLIEFRVEVGSKSEVISFQGLSILCCSMPARDKFNPDCSVGSKNQKFGVKMNSLLPAA